MKGKKHIYGNASQVTNHMADGGKVKGATAGNPRQHGMKKPATGGKPKRITANAPPGGSQTPGAKGTYPMADGGKAKKGMSKKKRKAKPSDLGTGAARGAAERVSGRQRQIDKALEDAGA